MPHTQSVRVRLVATLHTLSVRGCYNLYGMLKKRNRTRENGTSTEKRDGEREQVEQSSKLQVTETGLYSAGGTNQSARKGKDHGLTTIFTHKQQQQEAKVAARRTKERL